jgi:hypothetical protein
MWAALLLWLCSALRLLQTTPTPWLQHGNSRHSREAHLARRNVCGEQPVIESFRRNLSLEVFLSRGGIRIDCTQHRRSSHGRRASVVMSSTIALNIIVVDQSELEGSLVRHLAESLGWTVSKPTSVQEMSAWLRHRGPSGKPRYPVGRRRRNDVCRPLTQNLGRRRRTSVRRSDRATRYLEHRTG